MSSLDPLFYPRSVAVVGASANPDSGSNIIIFNPLLERGFQGKLYPIHPRASAIGGVRAYPRLADVPGPVDYVICALAGPLIPPLIEECAAKGVKGLHIFSAGFSETGQEEGRRLEGEIVARCRQSGIRVIGPNCFGLSCSTSGLCSLPDMPAEAGGFAFASQSSAIGAEFADAAGQRGVRFSKIACYGNGADVNETDFLEYFAHDPQTRVLGFYLEGIKSTRFLEVLRGVAAKKPVLLLKGGVSGAGARAVSSHTGSLVGRGEVWWALARQAGALAAEGFDDLVDLAVTFYHRPQLAGKRAAIVVFGGGFGVKAADDCERGGLQVPRLDPHTREALAPLMPAVGTSTANPLDVSPGVIWLSGPLFQAARALADSPSIDMVLVQLWVPSHSHRRQPELVEHQAQAMLQAHQELKKPVIGVNRFTASPEAGEMTAKFLKGCAGAGVPVYFSFYTAARALSRYVDYCQGKVGKSCNVETSL